PPRNNSMKVVQAYRNVPLGHRELGFVNCCHYRFYPVEILVDGRGERAADLYLRSVAGFQTMPVRLVPISDSEHRSQDAHRFWIASVGETEAEHRRVSDEGTEVHIANLVIVDRLRDRCNCCIRVGPPS